MNSNQILESLYQRYYSGKGFSEVTSSHWKQYGRKTVVNKLKDRYEFRSQGISTFNKKTLKSSIRNVPIRLLLHRLLKRHGSSDTTVRQAQAITNLLGVTFEFDHAKHVLSYDFLDSRGLFNADDCVCIIGDGHGFFGSLIKRMNLDVKILFVNLGRNLWFDVCCFSLVFPDLSKTLVRKVLTDTEMANHKAFFMEAENYELLTGLPISLFINIASMQEMNMDVIVQYFALMRSSSVETYFYCCNRLEKELPDGTVIRFFDYPWGAAEIIIDEPCPWYKEYPSLRPPFWRRFEPHLHRLVKLHASE